MDKDTLNISRWWPDDPIPVYWASEMEPEQIIITMSDVIDGVSKLQEAYAQSVIQTEQAATAFNKFSEFRFIIDEENQQW